MSYHVKGDVRFKDLPERILVREDGYMTAYVFKGEPIVNYWYMPEAENKELRNDAELLRTMLSQVQTEKRCYMSENAKLRELMRDLWEACPVDGYYCIYHCKHYDKESESHCKMEDRMRELGVIE